MEVWFSWLLQLLKKCGGEEPRLPADLERAQLHRDSLSARLVSGVAFGAPRGELHRLERVEIRRHAARPIAFGGADSLRESLRAERGGALNEFRRAGGL